MKIGELAARTGMTTSAIRFYEQSGLLPPAGRGANGYRIYDEAAAERLRQIQLAQRLGFSLDEMRGVAEDMDAFAKEGLLARIDERLREIDALRVKLDSQRGELQQIRDTLQAEWEAGRCLKVDALQAQAPAAAATGRRARRVAPAQDFGGRRKAAGNP
ncbi:MerR family transcriptional regulator [Burkholderia multivorans]|uniref:MerR family transcriptional regulator n=1 Tax=Burkholderia ubonensis TaxID=101571 RepID=UPI000F6F4992|nr:MerR family transcriptional regulator [Burkholderia ubonensis]AYZ63455.1 MerR family transcriptional regulator [Burkholderia multivorans]VWC20621.1 MerR family regulatory protein [Burkholderia ubonensis]